MSSYEKRVEREKRKEPDGTTENSIFNDQVKEEYEKQTEKEQLKGENP